MIYQVSTRKNRRIDRRWNNRKKHKGSGMLMTVLIATALSSAVAITSFKISQNALDSVRTTSISTQAEQYALGQVAILKSVNYSDLAGHSRQLIQNSNGYESSISLSEETEVSEGVKQRLATINIFRTGETLPRASLVVPRTDVEVESGGGNVPTGTILPWYGNVSEIPNGFALCNGSNGTPDLRNKFIVGAGSTYALGATGGADTVKLTSSHMASHVHGTGWHSDNNSGKWFSTGTSGKTVPLDTTYNTHTRYWNGSGSSDSIASISGSFSGTTIFTSLPIAAGTDSVTAHENRPPYYAVYFIMKL